METIEQSLVRLSHPSDPHKPPTLERMRALLQSIDDPQDALPCIHIGGTSGKGSTAMMCDAILRAAGYRVGLHTKPHLVCVNERMAVDGEPISDHALRRLIDEIAPHAQVIHPTWYELTLAIAFLHFQRAKVEIAIVEVGLGGQFDGTNVIKKPLVAILTNVGLDHTEILGNTIEKIASDKVAIIKNGCSAVSGVTQKSVQEIVMNKTVAQGVPLLRLGKEIKTTIHQSNASGSFVTIQTPLHSYKRLHIAPLGEHQATNAALAIAAVEQLKPKGYSVSENQIRKALSHLLIPGRMELAQRNPTLILDGAHNPDKMAAVLKAISCIFPNKRITAVAAFTRRHDAQTMMRLLMDACDRVILTSFFSSADFGPGSSIPPDELAVDKTNEIVPDPLLAIQTALARARKDDIILVTGSLYLVGAVRKKILSISPSPFFPQFPPFHQHVSRDRHGYA